MYVHYLGPNGTFTEIATKKLTKINLFANIDIEFVPCKTIHEVINNVDSANNSWGVVPIENSIEGIVRETLDCLVTASSKVLIFQETVIRISHCFITKAKKYDDVKFIISHPQSIAQCQNFLNRTFLNNIELINCSSNAEAVRSISDKSFSYAAIGPKISADIYKIPVLTENINDQPENYTKFIMIGNKIPTPTNNDQSSIAVSLRNEPGALVKVLNVFLENNINLCRIESRPSKRILGDYLFFIDFDGHIEDERIINTIGKIVPKINFYKFMGSYPKYSNT